MMQRWIKVRNIVALPKWNYYLLMLLTFAMPFYLRFLPYLISASLLSWVLQKNIIQRVKKAFSSRYFSAFILFYAIHLIGMIYTKDIDAGLFKLQVKLSLIIFPLIIFTSEDYLTEKKDKILYSFVYGNLLASLICIVVAVYHSFQNGGDELFNAAIWPFARNWSFIKLVLAGYSYFNYSWLSIFLHVSYFSMYLLLGMYFIYSRLISQWDIFSPLKRFYHIVIACFFLLMILLLQSRAAIIALSALFLFELVYYIFRPGKFRIKIILTGFFLVLISLVVYNSTRFNSLKKGALEISYEQLQKDNLRLLIWGKSCDIIKKNLITGVGTGDVKEAILGEYDQRVTKATEGKYYNSHNEFIETAVRLGLIGEASLLFILFSPCFSKSNRKKNRLLMGFLIIIILNFMFESMLDRLNGVAFFAFFYCLLILPERSS